MSTSTAEPLGRYRARRDFERTPEPAPERRAARTRKAKGLAFVIQKHWASRLHYDFRLEHDGVLLSWAVPKGPCFDPSEKRMAVHVEDHPLAYGSFEGTIPKGQYGAGSVIVWDRGTWEPVGDAAEGLAKGKLVFALHGQKLAGLWELVRIAKPGAKQDAWILFKKRDAWARPLAEYDVISALPDSVIAQPLGLVEERGGRAAAAPPVRAADLSLAKKARLPATLEPQLATLAAALPPGAWSLEPKWDGYRILARIDAKGNPRLLTRNGHDWSARMPTLAAAVRSLGLRNTWLDGEIVVLGEDGSPQFNRLQNAMDDARRNDEIVYCVFDLPFHDGRDLRPAPLAARRAALEPLLAAADSERVRLSPSFDAPAEKMLQAACAMNLEGIVAKRLDAPYVSARTPTWLKLKCLQRQEFVVVGFNDREGAEREVGSLLLAVHEAGALQYAGSVGTGWDGKTARQLHDTLAKLVTDTPPIDPKQVAPGRWSRRARGSQRWVQPELVVEVSFAEWTPERRVRHASFRGVRTDKRPDEVTREATVLVAAPPPAAATRAKTRRGEETTAAGIRVSHPDRVIDPSSGLKKLDLIRYYESIADRMLPHLAGRPVSLVRAPNGITGPQFFQKHPETRMPGLTALDPALWPGHAALLGVESAPALVAAAQMNVIELHTWNSTTSRIDTPDRIVFDLDPGEGVAWPQVQEAAQLMHALLEMLKLKAWLKTSGGKGLHVVVPIAPERDYETVKSFSQAVVQHLARTIPQKFVAKSGAANRVGRIFVDYLRNGHAQTTAAAFSARARPGLGVSMPVAWEQLGALKGGNQWTIATAREHVSLQREDPWAGYWSARQRLGPAMKVLGTRSPPV